MSILIASGLLKSLNGDAIPPSAGDSSYRLVTGDCFDWPTTGQVMITVPELPCAARHDGEVVGTFEIPGDTYPGDAELIVWAVFSNDGKLRGSVAARAS
jgi:hypothetical protein